MSNETNLNSGLVHSEANAEVLSPKEDMAAMASLVENARGVTAQMHINRFNNFSKDIVGFITGRGGNLNTWFSVVGGAYVKVAIVNDDDKVLFVVPAILARQPSVNQANYEQSLAGIMDKYHQLLSNSPIAAVRFITAQINNRPKERIVDNSIIVEWNNLLAYYNEPPLGNVTGVTGDDDGHSLMSEDEEEEFL